MEKVFDQELFGRRLKHVIEPIFTYRYTTGVDNFQNIIRFDQTDILSNTSEFEYDMIQRIYGRRRSDPSRSRLRGSRVNSAPGAPGKASASLHSRSERGAAALRGREQHHARVAELGGEAEVLLQPELRRRAGAGTPQRIHHHRGADRHGLPGCAARLESGGQQAAHSDLGQYRRAVAARLRFGSRPHQLQRGLSRISHLAIISSAEARTSFTCRQTRLRKPSAMRRWYSTSSASWWVMGIRTSAAFPEASAWATIRTSTSCNMPPAQSSYNWDCCGLSFEFRHIDVPGSEC